MATLRQDDATTARSGGSGAPGGAGDATSGGDRSRRAVFRTPAPALLVVFLLVICMVPFAFAAPGLPALLAVPFGLAVWIVRNRTTATREGLTVRTTLGTRELPWEAVTGLSLTRKAKVHAVLGDGGTVPLPGVRTRHLPVISFVSEGRVPDPSGLLDGTRSRTAARADSADSADAATRPEESDGADATTTPDGSDGVADADDAHRTADVDRGGPASGA